MKNVTMVTQPFPLRSSRNAVYCRGVSVRQIAMARGSRFILSVFILSAFLAISDGTNNTVSSNKDPKKILLLMPLLLPSHHILLSALDDRLLERGHHLTMVTSRPQKPHPHLRQILVRDVAGKVFADIAKDVTKGPQNTYLNILIYLFGSPFNDVVFNNPEVLALKNEKFDLVITQAFTFQESILAFAHHFGCPSMVVSPFGYSMQLNEFTGGATNPAYVPNTFGTVVNPKTFLDRLKATVTHVLWTVAFHLYYIPIADAQMRTAFPEAPHLYDLIKNVSLTLINNKDALMYPVPLAPSVIEVGGMHIRPGKPLPADLKNWIEDSKDGVVYFSLGSNLQANLLSEEKLTALLTSFGRLKQRVLVKWNAEVPANAPKNCRFEGWIPQLEVLAHPNVKVFFTHGGLLSTQEAVYSGVPLIGMPVFTDQFLNVEIAVSKGFAVRVSIFDLTTDALDAALAEVINNPKYRETSKTLSEYFRLDPTPPLDKAVYYTEQLMKLGSFKHLQPNSVNLNWYQYMLLDVIVVIALFLYVLWKIIRCLCNVILGLCKSSKLKNE